MPTWPCSMAGLCRSMKWVRDVAHKSLHPAFFRHGRVGPQPASRNIPQAQAQVRARFQGALSVDQAAIVSSIRTDGVKNKAVSRAFAAGRLAIVGVNGNSVQKTGFDQV